MRKFLMVTASLAGLGFAAQAAQAADMVAPEPEFSWTGFHVGVGGGGGWNLYDANAFVCEDSSEDCEEGDFDSANLTIELDADDLGAFYGFGTVEAGLDFQFPNSPFVLGVLANYDFNGDSSADAETNLSDDGDPAHLSIEAELKDTWFIGGRAGFSVWDNHSLVYVLGGYTFADGKIKSEFDVDCCGVFDSSHQHENGSVDGWTIGGGIETMLWDAVSLKLEYRHDFLDDLDFNEPTEDGEDDNTSFHEGQVDFSRDTVRAVLSWRFGSWW
jgi:outer membrane immunogenic protein